MSKEQEVAREIVCSFWAARVSFDNPRSIVDLDRVKNAKPEDLVEDYKVIIKILEKALKEIKSNDDSESEE